MPHFDWRVPTFRFWVYLTPVLMDHLTFTNALADGSFVVTSAMRKSLWALVEDEAKKLEAGTPSFT